MSTADLGVAGLQPNSWVELSATLLTTGIGGVVFDAYAPDRFKFAAIDVASQRVLIGHVENGRWIVDASAARTS